MKSVVFRRVASTAPIFYLLSPANVHDAPFAHPLLEWAVHLYANSPRIIRLDACAGYLIYLF
jgi:hypothetical protein